MKTLRDVAKVVGTSEATVSLVLNGRQYHRVSAQTRRRIEHAAKRLNYQPNRLAQNLIRGKTMNIMVLLNDLQNPFYAGMASRIIRTLEASDYHVLPVETLGDAEREARMLTLASQQTCDGVLCLEALPEQTPEVYRDLAQRMPFVVRHHIYGDLVFPIDPAVGRCEVDYGRGVGDLFAHLGDIGVSRLGLLLHNGHDPRNKPAHRSGLARFLGTQIESFGKSVAIASLDDESPLDDWYVAATKLAADHPDMDGLFIHHLRAVPAVLAALEHQGRRPGHDIAVASIDDDVSAKWLRPGLTVVCESVSDTVAALVASLLGRMSGRQVKPKTQRTALVVRESTSRFGLRTDRST